MSWIGFLTSSLDQIPESAFFRLGVFCDCLTLITLFVAQTPKLDISYVVSTILWRFRALFACATVAWLFMAIWLVLEGYRIFEKCHNELHLRAELVHLKLLECPLRLVSNVLTPWWSASGFVLLILYFFKTEEFCFAQSLLVAVVPTSVVFYWNRHLISEYTGALEKFRATKVRDPEGVTERSVGRTKCFVSVIWCCETILAVFVSRRVAWWTHMFVHSVYLSLFLLELILGWIEIIVGTSATARLNRKFLRELLGNGVTFELV